MTIANIKANPTKYLDNVNKMYQEFSDSQTSFVSLILSSGDYVTVPQSFVLHSPILKDIVLADSVRKDHYIVFVPDIHSVDAVRDLYNIVTYGHLSTSVPSDSDIWSSLVENIISAGSLLGLILNRQSFKFDEVELKCTDDIKDISENESLIEEVDTASNLIGNEEITDEDSQEEEGVYICLLCKFVADDLELFRMHIFKNGHPTRRADGKLLYCRLCNNKSCRRDDFEKHVKTKKHMRKIKQVGDSDDS